MLHARLMGPISLLRFCRMSLSRLGARVYMMCLMRAYEMGQRIHADAANLGLELHISLPRKGWLLGKRALWTSLGFTFVIVFVALKFKTSGYTKRSRGWIIMVESERFHGCQ